MTFIYAEYGLLLLYMICALMLAAVLLPLAWFFSSSQDTTAKLSPYECGFDPYDDARNEFEVHFYLLAILFLIFDLEASFLFPWSCCVGKLSGFSFWVFADFFGELTLGFLFVWRRSTIL